MSLPFLFHKLNIVSISISFQALTFSSLFTPNTKSLRLAENAYTFAKEKNFSNEEAIQQVIKVFYSGYGFYQEPSPDSKQFDLAAISSPDGMYLASFRRLFNAQNELIVTFNLDRIDNPGITLSFSEDSKFLKISYSSGPHRIFPLDPEFILNRINDFDIMGSIAKMNEADKERFLIVE
jgi:hypothetical protein